MEMPVKEFYSPSTEDDSPSCIYTIDAHRTMVLEGLNQMRERGLFIDVTLIAEKKKFYAHRAVLASSSEYFRAMFTNSMIESQKMEINLDEVSPEGLSICLEYVYTAKLELNHFNVQYVLRDAHYLQLLSIVKRCCDFLYLRISISNCVDMATTAELYSLSHLKRNINRYICDNLYMLYDRSQFLRLSATTLEGVLASSFPVQISEDQVLHYVVNWINHDSKNRMQYAKSLISLIYFHQLSPDCISNLFLSFPGLDQQETYMQKQKCRETDYLVNVRGMEIALVVVGGFGSSGMTNRITYLHNSLGTWRRLTTIPHIDQCNFGTTVWKNHLFVVGGCFNQNQQENIHDFGFMFNPCNKMWNPIARMLNNRCRFPLTVVNDQMYAIGGVGEGGDFLGETAPCEVFNRKANTWKSICGLPGQRSQHSACTWHESLFVSGGIDSDDLPLNSFYRYDTAGNTWVELCPMPTPRVDHTMMTYGDKIYVCGGWYKINPLGTRFLCENIIFYDIFKEEWVEDTVVPTPRLYAGITIMKSKIYLTAGLDSDREFDRGSAVMECYDLTTRNWEKLDNYSCKLWEHSCCVLYVPTHHHGFIEPRHFSLL